MLLATVAGGASPQSSSISRSVETTSFACSSSTASSERCLRPPSASGRRSRPPPAARGGGIPLRGRRDRTERAVRASTARHPERLPVARKVPATAAAGGHDTRGVTHVGTPFHPFGSARASRSRRSRRRPRSRRSTTRPSWWPRGAPRPRRSATRPCCVSTDHGDADPRRDRSACVAERARGVDRGTWRRDRLGRHGDRRRRHARARRTRIRRRVPRDASPPCAAARYRQAHHLRAPLGRSVDERRPRTLPDGPGTGRGPPSTFVAGDRPGVNGIQGFSSRAAGCGAARSPRPAWWPRRRVPPSLSSCASDTKDQAKAAARCRSRAATCWSSGSTAASPRRTATPRSSRAADPRATRRLTALKCKRVAYAAGTGICLAERLPAKAVPAFQATFFDAEAAGDRAP